ncbi:hypothetical protein DITRI_Ditri03aG0143600 [Diplodiscus trichospermus]
MTKWLKGSVKIIALHPTSLKQASITPLPLPLPSTQFSSQNNMLDPGSKFPNSHFSLSDDLGRRFSDSYVSYDQAMSYDSRVQKTAQNYANYRSCNSMRGRFGAETSMVEDESDASTPPLWRTSPSRSPPHRQNINYRCLSPASKSQAIARGQRELMEMVSRMPESCYELTLKDLVEHQPAAVEPKQESFAEGRGAMINEDKYKAEKENKKKKKTEQSNPKAQIKRSGSIDNGGFLLKMVFPISLGSKNKKKKKKNDSNTNHNSKVSPKPTVSDSSGKSVDKEWWKKRSGSSESESGGSTLNSGSTKSSRSSSISSSSSRSNSNGSRRHRSGCLAFILTRKGKASG